MTYASPRLASATSKDGMSVEAGLAVKPTFETMPERTGALAGQWLAFLGGHGIHPKLEVSDPDDADEREAEAIADRIMRMTAPPAGLLPVSTAITGSISRACCSNCASDEDGRRIAREYRGGVAVAQGAAEAAADAVSSGGRPLDAMERGFFEPRFGRDLSEVRIHTGPRADSAATGIGALAYTIGQHIAFAAEQYQPDSDAGLRLLAHELTHAVQQRAAGPKLRRKSNLADCLNQKDDILPPHVGLLTVIAREQELAAKLGAGYEPLKQLIKKRPEARALVCHYGVPGVLALASTKTAQGVLDLPAANAKLAKTTAPAAPAPAALPAATPAPGAADFKIEQEGSSTTSRIYFTRGSAALDSADKAQIDAVKVTKPSPVRLIGYASADETATLAQTRADTVKAEFAAAPNPITVSSAVGNAPATASRGDFSGVRSVEILVGSATPATPDCKKKDPTGKLVNPPTQPCPAMDPPTWTSFQTAHGIAKDATAKAVAAVAGTPSADDTALIDRYFGGHDAATLTTLQTNFGNLSTQVTDLPAKTDCGGRCDTGGCEKTAIAYTNGSVDAAMRMTICVPRFKDLKSDEDRARNLVHETAHGTSPLGGGPGKGTEDVAYRHERMLFELTPADRLRNSDSYALFALFVREIKTKGDPKAVPPGIKKPATDVLPYTDKEPEKPALKLAIAKLEKRLGWCADWLDGLYGEIVKVRAGSLTWAASWAEELMTEAAKRFPLAPPTVTQTLDDQTRVAAIGDRYERMSRATKEDLVITRMPSGVVSWKPPAAGASPWIAGTTLGIGPDFFRAPAEDQVSLLLEQLAKATKDVETPYVPAYVSLAKWIHDKNP
jgi:hypothetical protein